MSYCNNNSQRTPGAVRGNATTGITERASIQVDKVFDSCISQETLTDMTLTLTNVVPDISTLVAPFRFLSGTSATTSATLDDLTVSELPDEKCCARVTCDVVIPVEVAFVDANGTRAVGYASITVPKDIIMKVTAPSVVPYEVRATANVSIPEGEFTTGTTLTVACCVTIIMQVVINVQLLVPTYGYTYIPPCQNFTDEVCQGVFDLPIYPDDNCNDNGNCPC